MRLTILLLFFFGNWVFSSDYGKVTEEEIVENVYLFRTAPYGVGLSGNSAAILTDEGVVVFDTNGLPSTTRTILQRIRKYTTKPVLYVINSHWHWDHWAGNEVYRAEFPDAKIVAHAKTVEQLKAVEPEWNNQALKTGLPQYLKQLEQQLQDARSANRRETEIRELEELLAAGKDFLAQKTSLKKTLPDTTFENEMVISPGGMEIQIRHARAITVGDAYLWLPRQKILITGDILLSPYPYAVGGTYPADWLSVLESMARLKPEFIIPGHGPAQKPEFLKQNIMLYRTILEEVRKKKKAGASLDQTQTALGERTRELIAILGVKNEQTVAEFKAYFLDVFVSRAYRELEDPLSDLPDGLTKN